MIVSVPADVSALVARVTRGGCGSVFDVTPISDILSSDDAAALYNAHAAELRRFLTGVLRDPDRAGDAVQATFLKMLEQGHLVRRDAFKAWLFQVGMREALVVKRRQATREKHAEGVGRWNRGRNEASLPAPESEVETREEVERMRSEMERLPPDQKTAVELKVGEGLTYREIAQRLGIPEGTVVTRVRLGMERLARGLKRSE